MSTIGPCINRFLYLRLTKAFWFQVLWAQEKLFWPIVFYHNWWKSNIVAFLLTLMNWVEMMQIKKLRRFSNLWSKKLHLCFVLITFNKCAVNNRTKDLKVPLYQHCAFIWTNLQINSSYTWVLLQILRNWMF